MADIKIPRTGDIPLEFEGEALGSVSTRSISGTESTRWHEITVYHAAGGVYVMHVGFRTEWRGEPDHDCALVTQSLEEAAEYVYAIALPVPPLAGYPPLAGLEARRARLEHDLFARLGAALAKVLSQANDRGKFQPVEDAPSVAQWDAFRHSILCTVG